MSMKGTDVNQLIADFKEYTEAAAWIEKQVKNGRLKPVVTSGYNGKVPPLYKRYLTLHQKKDTSLLEQELHTQIMPPLSSSFYLSHLSQYEKDRPYVLLLNDWIRQGRLPRPSDPLCSVNERSFEIWGQEKFLKSPSGRRILKNAGLDAAALHFYDTYEPLVSWYSISQEPGQNILIVENLDPFVSIRRAMMQGHRTFLGMEFGTVLYGAGKKICSSFRDLVEFGQDYLKNEENVFWYFGDLDYEGIQIFETFMNRYARQKIRLLVPAYEKMLAEGKRCRQLPQTKEDQKESQAPGFWKSIQDKAPEAAVQMHLLLENRMYIPQEILSASLLMQKED